MVVRSGSLVKRLDGYVRKYKDLVQEVLDLLNREFKFIISRQARSSRCRAAACVCVCVCHCAHERRRWRVRR